MDGISEVEIYCIAGTHTIPSITTFLRSTAGHITGDKIAKSRITTLQVIVAVFFGYFSGFQLACTNSLSVFLFLGHPDAAVVAEAFAHQREFALVVAMHGDTGGVDLHIAGVGEGGPFAVAHPCSTAVAVHGIGGEVIEIAVTASGQYHGVGGIAFQVAGDQVAHDDATSATVHHHEVHHLASRV